MSFKDIARRIGKHETSVSREVKKHLKIQKTTVVRKDKDGNVINSVCKSLLKAPFCCNPCRKRHVVCAFDKYIYCAKNAQKEYESILVAAREGIPLNKEKFYQNDKIISEGFGNGQHLYQIMRANDLGVCAATVYNHAKRGYFSFDNINFPRIVKFKARRSKPRDYIPTGLKKGRTYSDFTLFMSLNELVHYVEMDTVIGRIGGKAILTLIFTSFDLMLAFVVDNLSSACVSAKIVEIKTKLSNNGLSFGQFFPVILTDNGGEFADVLAFENDLAGKREARLFFCDPCKSWQKPHIEKNHSLLRDILPKGTSFDSLSQDRLNLVLSHVNSTARPHMGGKTPYELFCFTYSSALTDAFDIGFIPPKNVIQSPKLFTP